MSRADGGPAFPSIAEIGNIMTTDGGMTLRDYFAAKAMQGFLANGAVLDAQIYAKAAYEMADEMLAERAK